MLRLISIECICQYRSYACRIVQGIFVRTWCPELARLPNEYIHTPWLAPAHVLKDANVELGVNYPRPLMVATQWNQQVTHESFKYLWHDHIILSFYLF
jgi:deoxyribodipyrimidine photolyase